MGKAGKKMKLAQGTNAKAAPKAAVTLAGNGWDMGPRTALQDAGKVIEGRGEINPETGEMVNPNGVMGARRVDLVEIYGKRGWLEPRHVTAAKALRMAWEGTMKSPDAIKAIQVDSSPKPDHAVAMQIDRISKFSKVMGLVPKRHREIIDMTVLRGGSPAQLRQYRGPNFQAGIAALRVALDNLANDIGC